MIICARFWRNSKGPGERKTMDLGMCMVSQEAGMLQRGIFLKHILSAWRIHLSGRWWQPFRQCLCLYAEKKNVIALLHSSFINTSNSLLRRWESLYCQHMREGLGHSRYVTVFGNKNGRGFQNSRMLNLWCHRINKFHIFSTYC